MGTASGIMAWGPEVGQWVLQGRDGSWKGFWKHLFLKLSGEYTGMHYVILYVRRDTVSFHICKYFIIKLGNFFCVKRWGLC
jgi:hypothetical protein